MDKKKLLNLLLACLSGFLLAVSTQEHNLTPIAWVALAPLFYAVKNSNFKQSILCSLCAGILYNLKLHLWANVFGAEVWIAMALVQTTYFIFWGASLNLIIKKIKLSDHQILIFIPLWWVVFDTIRGSGPIGVNWGCIAYTQYKFLPLLQITPITGIYGPLFLMAYCSSIVFCISEWITENKYEFKKLPAYIKTHTLIFIIILSGVVLYGQSVINRDKHLSGDKIKVALLQPSIDMLIKTDSSKTMDIVETMKEMTLEAAELKPDIIFWPETSFPALLPESKDAVSYLSKLSQICGTDMVVGAPQRLADKSLQNSAFHFNSQGELLGSYSKRKLVPFGEFLPLPSFAKKWAVFRRVQNFKPGTEASSFKVKNIRFGTIICFESDFPECSAQEVNNGARFISVITNDGWFENYPAAKHHISWDVFRAAENHVNLVQAANSGISAVIDYNGKILEKKELFEKGIICRELNLLTSGTFYSKYGNIFLYLLYFTALLVIISAISCRKKRIFK